MEYYFRHALGGKWIWGDRAIRFLLATLLIYILLSSISIYRCIHYRVIIGVYGLYWRKAKSEKPFPYDHFINLEQNRMMRFLSICKLFYRCSAFKRFC